MDHYYLRADWQYCPAAPVHRSDRAKKTLSGMEIGAKNSGNERKFQVNDRMEKVSI